MSSNTKHFIKALEITTSEPLYVIRSNPRYSGRCIEWAIPNFIQSLEILSTFGVRLPQYRFQKNENGITTILTSYIHGVGMKKVTQDRIQTLVNQIGSYLDYCLLYKQPILVDLSLRQFIFANDGAYFIDFDPLVTLECRQLAPTAEYIVEKIKSELDVLELDVDISFLDKVLN